MACASQEPDPREGGPVAKWNYAKIPNGGHDVGFLAQHPFGVYCHTVNVQSKPCLARITKGELKCQWCVTGAPEWRGYTPFYSPEYTRLFVLITRDYLEAVREIAVFDQIKLVRARPMKSPIVIRKDAWRTQPIPPSRERPEKFDLFPALLRVWKNEELTRWHYSKPPVPEPVAPILTVEDLTPEERSCLPADPIYHGPWLKVIRDRRAKEADTAMGVIDTVLAAKTGRNGKHKKQE